MWMGLTTCYRASARMTAIVSLMITTVLEQEPERVPVSIWSVKAVSDNLRGPLSVATTFLKIMSM